MVILDAVQSVLSIMLMISIGYFLAYKGWFNEDASKLFSKIVVNISLPALMLSNFMTTFTKEDLSQAGIGITIPFASIILSYFISVLISRFIKLQPNRKGTFQCMMFLSNSIFIGLPINLALFGDISVPYVLYYYLANSTMFWTLGVYVIRRDSGTSKEKILSLATFKKIFTPPLMGFIIALILIMLGIKLPKFLLDSCKYIGNITTPLSMFFIGIVIYGINLKNIKFDKDMFWIFIGRFIISPLTAYLFCLILKAPQLMKNVFIIQASLPVMANTAIVTKQYNADYEYAAVMVALTTVSSLLFIPIFRFLLG